MAHRRPMSRRERARAASRTEKGSRRGWLVKLVVVGIVLLFILSSLVALFVH